MLGVRTLSKHQQRLSVIAVFQGTHTDIALEIFPEKRHVGEMKGIGNGLDGQVGGFQLRLGIHDDHRGDDVDTRTAAHLLDYRAEVGMGDLQLLGIPSDVARMRVVLNDQLRKHKSIRRQPPEDGAGA